MSQLVRMDRSGHTTLAEWSVEDPTSVEAAVRRAARRARAGLLAVVPRGPGQAEQVRELPLDAPLVILRRPIAGG